MNYFILVALLNGIVIGTSRTVYGQLGAHVGPFNASIWAHVVGFSFLTILILTVGEAFYYPDSSAPVSAYIGGVFGALFVVVSSYVFPRLGAMNAALFVISGQMITAVVLDWHNTGAPPTSLTCFGVIVVLVGIYLSKVVNSSESEA